jgi:hypothetical protein
MNSAEKSIYFSHLIDLYDHMADNDMRYDSIDNVFTNESLSLLDINDIPAKEITNYCIEQHDLIHRAFHKVNIPEIKQPASLLLFYYLEYYEDFIEFNWPFSVKLYREFKLALGLAGHH